MPNVSSWVLLTVALAGSETDHLTLDRLDVVLMLQLVVESVVSQLFTEKATAANFVEFPGGGSMGLAAAL